MGPMSAAVCMRGHFISNSVVDADERLQDISGDFLYTNLQGIPGFCQRCGSPVMTKCKHCGQELPPFSPIHRAPAFCGGCGKAHPWATREELVGSLYNQLDFEDLGEAERLRVAEALAVLADPESADDDERQTRAGEIVKSIAPRLWEFGKPVLIAVLTAAAQRRLGLS